VDLGACPTVRERSGSARRGSRRHPRVRAARGAGLVMVPEGRGVFGAVSVEENLRTGSLRDAEDRRGRLRTTLAFFEAVSALAERRGQTAERCPGRATDAACIGRALMSRPSSLRWMSEHGLAPIAAQRISAGDSRHQPHRRHGAARGAERSKRACAGPTAPNVMESGRSRSREKRAGALLGRPPRARSLPRRGHLSTD